MANKSSAAQSGKKSRSWSDGDRLFAQQARGLNALRLEEHIRKLQRHTGRSRRNCTVFIHQHIFENAPKSWTDEKIEEVRELLAAHPVRIVAQKTGRSESAIRNLCTREKISIRAVRSDLFSIRLLAAAMHVRKSEILYWIERGWLIATPTKAAGARAELRISTDALQRCLRVHRTELERRNVRSTTILGVFQAYCYVPKHTEGEQLLQVREAKREDDAYEARVS